MCGRFRHACEAALSDRHLSAVRNQWFSGYWSFGTYEDGEFWGFLPAIKSTDFRDPPSPLSGPLPFKYKAFYLGG